MLLRPGASSNPPRDLVGPGDLSLGCGGPPASERRYASTARARRCDARPDSFRAREVTPAFRTSTYTKDHAGTVA